MPEEHDCDVDQEPVGERVGDLPELRLDMPAAGEVAVDLVGDRAAANRIAAGQLWPFSERGSARVNGDDEEARDGERVRNLRQGP